MTILAIDPGNEQSAWCEYSDGQPRMWGELPNADLLGAVSDSARWATGTKLAIEMVASYGMPVGYEVFETCFWAGRFAQAWNGPYKLVYRKDVKLHLCNHPRANDATIRQALIDRYGGKGRAIGNKAQPGPLYGVKADAWAALAVAVTATETCTW